MNQPSVLPNVEGMRLVDGEVEHLLGLLGGKDVGDGGDGAIGLPDLIADLADLEVTCPDPVAVQLRMPQRPGLGLGVLRIGEGEGV